MIAALVPVKDLPSSKSRLRTALGDDAGRLTLAMLGDVLDALLAVPQLARVAVVTPDRDVAEAASAAGAEALLRPDPGLNAAVDGAAPELAANAGDGLLVVQGDVPGVRAQQIAELLAAAFESGVVLAPSSDGGTSALVRVPAEVIPAGFGPASAKVHRDLASRAGLPFRELVLPSLAIDVDDREDLEALLRSDAAAPRTRALLRELDWSGGG